MTRGVLHTDGASRGNPGPAGIGFTLSIDDELTYRGGSFIGETSNNVAEYNALIWALENAKAAGVDDLEVQADSELMIKQLSGVYRVKNEGLKPLFSQAKVLLGEFENVSLKHVYREHNSDADALANEALDAHGTVGEFLRKPTLKQSLFDFASVPSVTDSDNTDASHSDASISKPCANGSSATSVDVKKASYPTSDASGIYELTVKEHFDAAHALRGYPGQCRDLHGHTWDIEATVSGNQLDDIGILYDFKKLKADLREILSSYDHAYLNEVEPFTDINSTAENLARVIYGRLKEGLPSHISLDQVCVWESPAARLVYREPGTGTTLHRA